MNWLDEMHLDRFQLLPGASSEQLEMIEALLGVLFPADYREFLQKADGGLIGNFMLYSAGEGMHSEETLLRANLDRAPQFPLLSIGRDASYDFGFRKGDLSLNDCPIYFYIDEIDALDLAAMSFRELLTEFVSLEPGRSFVPASKRKQEKS
jgi:hypothetical protein